METVCLADVCFVFTASDTAELKSGGNARYAVHGFRVLKEPKVLMLVLMLVLMVMMMVMMTVMMTMSCLLL